MKIAILGTGGVGGYIGGKLVLVNDCKQNHITFISRGRQLKKIKESGLKIIDEDKEYIVKPDTICDNPKNTEKFDFIIVSVKSYDLRSALDIIKENVSDNTILLPLLNGVDHDKEIKKIFPSAKVLNGCIYILSNIKKPGVIKKYGGVFRLIFGSSDLNIENFQNIKKLFDEAGLANKLTINIELETWKKYLLISAYASMTSYYQKPLGYIANEKLDELEEVLKEIKNIAHLKNINIEDETINKILQSIKTLPYESKTSMQLDYEKGKKTEVEALCGYIVKEANKFNVKVPNMHRYYNVLTNKNNK